MKTLEMRLSEGREYRDIDVSRIEHRAGENGEKIVEGYATTFNQPYELFRDSYAGETVIFMEQVDPNAFADTDMTDVIMQYNHEGRVFARTSNGTLGLDPDMNGLHIRADLGGTEIGRQLYEEIEGGYTDKMSFGFRVGKDRVEQTEERDEETGITTVVVLRTILEITKLYDVSAVSLPANDATSISVRSFTDGVIEEVKKEHLAREARERQKQKIKILTEVK